MHGSKCSTNLAIIRKSMRQAQIGDLEAFVRIQCDLLQAVKTLYPDAKDSTWLLDFPRSGIVRIADEEWEFTKHGAGLRFIRRIPRPRIVADIHKHIGEPYLIDEWRLEQYFVSCGLSAENTAELIDEARQNGRIYLKDIGFIYVESDF